MKMPYSDSEDNEIRKKEEQAETEKDTTILLKKINLTKSCRKHPSKTPWELLTCVKMDQGFQLYAHNRLDSSWMYSSSCNPLKL